MSGVSSAGPVPGLPRPGVPAASPQLAYFLDFDGTLVELAPTPWSVTVDESIRAIVAHLAASSGGAFAIISGRSIADLDAMFGPARLPIAGQHGLERRTASGEVLTSRHDPRALQDVRTFLATQLARHPGLVLEDKGLSMALHYRTKPQLGAFAHRLMKSASWIAGSGYQLQRGKCVVELLPDATDKGDAIRAYMSEPPFQGRVPVFIGDDRTDEAGFSSVNALGGISIKVGRGRTLARWSMPDVEAVRTWLLALASPTRVHPESRSHADT